LISGRPRPERRAERTNVAGKLGAAVFEKMKELMADVGEEFTRVWIVENQLWMMTCSGQRSGKGTSDSLFYDYSNLMAKIKPVLTAFTDQGG